jgi:type III secretion system YscQ/HrcQ family protein
MPESWTVELPPLGTASMAFAGYAEAPAGDRVELAVSFGVGRGRVMVESAFAMRLVDVVLGGADVFATARAVGPAERGILVGVLGPVFGRIGGAVLLDRTPPPRERRDREVASLAFRLETAIGTGWLRLTAPPIAELTAGLGGLDVWRTRAGRIPVTGRIEIAATRVPAGALVRLAAGDAVVFDGVRSAAYGAAVSWPGRVRVGPHAAEVAFEASGKLWMVGGFMPVQEEEGNMSAASSNTDTTTVLAAASIEVIAEIGRLTLRGDELLGLAPGAVLAVGTRPTGVSLRVGGEIWAEGEIVDVDGELGVRVTRIVNR